MTENPHIFEVRFACFFAQLSSALKYLRRRGFMTYTAAPRQGLTETFSSLETSGSPSFLCCTIYVSNNKDTKRKLAEKDFTY